jgi:outer membrane protein, heavy metal efflux system
MQRLARLRGRCGLCAAALCAAVAVEAAEPVSPPAPTTSVISIAALIEAAIQADVGLRASEIRLRAASVAGALARRWDDPVIGLEGGRSQRDADGSAWRGRIEVMQRLPLGGEHRARAADAASQHALADAERLAARAALRAEVRLLVLDLRLCQAQAAGARTALADAATALAQVSERLAAGTARQTDLLLAQLDRDEAEAETALTGQQTLAARAALARRCALPAEQLADIAPVALEERDLDAVLTAVARHPRLLAADARARAAVAQAALVRSERWRDVRAGVFGERDGDENAFGVMLEVPLPAWNRGRAGLATAVGAADVAQAERAAAARQVAAEAEATWFAWTGARQRAQHHRERLLPAAGAALTLALIDYGAGRGDLASVLAALRARTRLTGETIVAEAERDRLLIAIHTIAPIAEEVP